MEQTYIHDYFAFGYDYYLLRYETKGRTVQGEEDTLESMLANFFGWLEDLNLQVTSQAAQDLRAIYERVTSMADNKKVDADLAREVSDACNKIDTTLDAELQMRYAYVVTPKRFHIEYLLDNPQKLLNDELVSRLSTIALFDFSSACRAIAFGLPTAAAFHLMRSVEAMLRDYYHFYVKRKRLKHPLWYPMVQQLRARQKSPPRAILDHLDNIRVNFRNPTQHPDARYELEEAEDLLSLSIDVLNRMARDLAARESRS